jgi:membrane-associated phospholipid phosphatase
MADISKSAANPLKQAETSPSGGSLSWLPYSQRRIAIVAALWVLAFVILTSLALYLHAHPSATLPGDVGLILLIQGIRQPLIVGFINFASDANWPTPAGATVLLVALLLVIFRRWRYAIAALFAGFLADGASFWLNSWVHRPRPNNTHIHAVANIGLSSFPSGHVSHVTAFYGLLLFLTFQELRVHPRWTSWIRVIQAICLYFLVFIGISRVLEGEHWPSDVLASYLLGGLTLVVAIVLYELLGRFKMRNSEGVVENADQAVRRTADSKVVTTLAHAGYAAKAIVYLIIGGLALAVALNIGGGLVDQTGATQVIYHQPFGKFLLIISAIGWFGYALWCVIEATLDTEHYGTDAKGVIVRLGYAVVALTYGALAYFALSLATGKSSSGKSSNAQAQDWTARLLAAPGGVALVIVVGLVVLGVAGALYYRAYTADFRKQLELSQASANVRDAIVLLGRIGNAALGVVFTVIGVFFIVAALQHNPSQAKGLSGALGAMLAQPFGHLLLALVALGLLAYGVYSLTQARYRRIRVPNAG